MFIRVAAVVVTICLVAPCLGQTTWHVDEVACVSPGKGTPADPFCTIQDGIDAAQNGDTVIVKSGIYRELLNTLGKSITLRSADPDDSVIVAATIVSGDIDDNGAGDGSVITCASGEGAGTVIAGFTIRDGAGTDISGSKHGGAMYLPSTSPTVRHCTFVNNSATRGGAMFLSGSSASIERCAFIDNAAGIEGGAMVITAASAPSIVECDFIGNEAIAGGAANVIFSDPVFSRCAFDGNSGRDGGALNNYGNTVTVNDCVFENNSAINSGGAISNLLVVLNAARCTFKANLSVSSGSWGGAIGNAEAFGAVAFCRFFGNTSNGGGGAIGNLFKCDITVVNCAFHGNHASGGGVIYSEEFSFCRLVNSTLADNSASEGGAIYDGFANTSAHNCILWNNAGGEIDSDDIVPVTYSLVQGSYPGPGNLDSNAAPAFADPDGMDDDPLTIEDNDYRLSAGSPCIDAGRNSDVPAGVSTDLSGVARFADDPDTIDTGVGAPPIVDMGAFEFQQCLADISGDDDDVNVFDLFEMLGNWNTGGAGAALAPPFDVVDVFDLFVLLDAWGPC